MSWFKRLFKKKDEMESFWAKTNFSYYTPKEAVELGKVIAEATEKARKATEEIGKLHHVTQNILKDLDKTDIHTGYMSFQPREVHMLETGKIIEEHIQRAIFEKKIEDIINDK